MVEDTTTEVTHNPLQPLIASSLRKDESFSSDTVKNKGVAEIMGDTLNMMEAFINDMVSETSHMDASTVVEDNNKTTVVSKLEKAKPIVVHENNNGAMKLSDTRLKSNNTVGAHIGEKWKDGFTKGLTVILCGMITPIHL